MKLLEATLSSCCVPSGEKLLVLTLVLGLVYVGRQALAGDEDNIYGMPTCSLQVINTIITYNQYTIIPLLKELVSKDVKLGFELRKPDSRTHVLT